MSSRMRVGDWGLSIAAITGARVNPPNHATGCSREGWSSAARRLMTSPSSTGTVTMVASGDTLRVGLYEILIEALIDRGLVVEWGADRAAQKGDACNPCEA